ncbi:hypothetical protein LEP1GSC040_2467, partial [Leptospira santarosai str. 2000030832]
MILKTVHYKRKIPFLLVFFFFFQEFFHIFSNINS